MLLGVFLGRNSSDDPLVLLGFTNFQISIETVDDIKQKSIA